MAYDPARPPITAPRTTNGVREWFEWVDLATYGRERVAYPTGVAAELARLGSQPKWITTRG